MKRFGVSVGSTPTMKADHCMRLASWTERRFEMRDIVPRLVYSERRRSLLGGAALVVWDGALQMSSYIATGVVGSTLEGGCQRRKALMRAETITQNSPIAGCFVQSIPSCLAIDFDHHHHHHAQESWADCHTATQGTRIQS